MPIAHCCWSSSRLSQEILINPWLIGVQIPHSATGVELHAATTIKWTEWSLLTLPPWTCKASSLLHSATPLTGSFRKYASRIYPTSTGGPLSFENAYVVFQSAGRKYPHRVGFPDTSASPKLRCKQPHRRWRTNPRSFGNSKKTKRSWKTPWIREAGIRSWLHQNGAKYGWWDNYSFSYAKTRVNDKEEEPQTAPCHQLEI